MIQIGGWETTFLFGEGLFLGVMASCWFQGGYQGIDPDRQFLAGFYPSSRIEAQVFGSVPKLSRISRRKNAKKS